MTGIGLCLCLFALTRGILRWIPGDPVEILLAETGTQLSREALSASLGLDRAYFPSLAHDLPKLFTGDWGLSLISREPVFPTIADRLCKTLGLTTLALTFALPLSLLLGISAGSREFNPSRSSRIASVFCTGLGTLSAATPLPWIGVIVSLIFCFWIPIFELTGSRILAALTLSSPFIGSWSRLIRRRTIESLRKPAALAARARGITEPRIAWRYGWIPAAGPLVAYLGSQLGGLLAGAFVVETLFDFPGMGLLFVEAVHRRDYPIVEACVWVSALLAVLGAALGDAAQGFIDPRLELLEQNKTEARPAQ